MASENGSEISHWKVQTPQNAQNEIKTSEIELPEQYELLGKLNQGAMGAVYKAKNRYTEAKFAIKVLKPECANDAETRQRFILEAKASSSLKHPQICEVFDFGCTANGMLFLVMQWIDGISLQSMIDKDGPLPVKEALPLFIQIASALGHAHKHKIIHRDLKPANVMLSGNHDGKINVHIVDFGIAKVLSDEEDAANRSALTRTGIVLGTPLYMSPEQSRGKSLNQRSDIYALGCLIYFVLTGHPPFEGDGFMDTMYKHIHEPPPDFDAKIPVPEDLKLIMLKCLEKEPEDRFQSMEDLVADLKKIAKGVSVAHRPLAAERKKQRNKYETILYFVIGFIVMYGVSIAIQGLLGDSDAAKNAKQNNDSKK